MFSVDEISRRRHRPDKSPQIDRKPGRPSEAAEPNMPMKTHRDKKSLSRLNLAGEKTVGIHRSLSQLEEEFIFAAEFGDIPTVKRVLEEQPSFNVDYSDIIGRTPLRLAVGNEHLEVVELLLVRSNVANIHEALLQAISAGHEQIAETILKHPKYTDVKKENKRFGETDYFFNTTSEDSPFSSDITPLILAAERNQFEIVQLLLLRGETIKKPHHYYCNCQECSNKLEFDQLRLAKTRLNAYKGLSSGAYISLSSKDPILTAFELAQELRRVAKVEKYYKSDYLMLADQLSEYVVKLLDKVRGHDELEILLNKKKRDANDESYEQLSRLKLAIHYNEKKFVAHPSCQQKLVSIWYDDLRAMERSNWFVRSLMVAGITLVYPLLAVLYWFIPRSKVGKFLRYPCIKFIGHTMSFITFLLMMVISSAAEGASVQKKLSSFMNVYPHFLWYRSKSNYTLPLDFVVRSSRPEIIHLFLSLWIIGMLWQEVKQIYGDGVYDYFDSLYNYLDVAVLTLYITSFTLRNVSIWKVNVSLEYFSNREKWQDLLDNNATANENMYWLIADRFYWDSIDPHNVAESLFAIANVISFTRVSYVLPTNEIFGPMQISLGRMLTDILKFLCIFSVVFVAFMIGLHNLYWYYPKTIRQQVEFLPNNVTTAAELAFGLPNQTFRTVFWSLFGRGEPTVVELGEFNHMFTQYVGYWIYGAYNFLGVIVLLNMLIAMMSRSFEVIQEEADTEWKFSRSKLYMEYIKEGATLPIPFNIIPSPKSMFYVIRFFYRLCCKTEDMDPRPHPGRIKDIELYSVSAAAAPTLPGWEETSNGTKRGIKRFQERMHTTNGFVRSDSDHNLYEEKLTYKRVMKRIVKRYIFDVQRDDERPEGDFDEVKQDISSFRYEILNHLENRVKGNMETTQKMITIENKLDMLMRQQEMLLKHIYKGYSPMHLDDIVPDLTQSNPDILSPKNGIFSESECLPSEETVHIDDGTEPCVRMNKQLEDIPEEDTVLVAKQCSSAHTEDLSKDIDDITPPLTNSQNKDIYVDDVIVEVNVNADSVRL